ncbi:GNAT family N-acetyltransferase [Demequina sp.]|uniref:GNAT family N-acetyltransferase n=1 Tax=Demequina sp. TaxID=2050685 RepID=UPI003A866337
MPGTAAFEVTRDRTSSRYVIEADGDHAGHIDFEERDGAVVMTHTEVDEAYRGTEAARTLAGGALADVAARGLAVVPECPYIARYLSRNEVPGLEIRPLEVRSAEPA